jgi:hypothetical protein
MEGIVLRKNQIAIIVLFTILITCFGLYFQWAEFYDGYSYNSGNLAFSILFLSAWVLFSFYWGIIQEKKYQKFIIVYWGINIIASIAIWIFANNKFVQSVLFPFYIWCGGPLYGFRYMLFHLFLLDLNEQTIILITSPLGISFSFIGYWLGCRILKSKKPLYS